jgi:hypothetical protein
VPSIFIITGILQSAGIIFCGSFGKVPVIVAD